MKHNVCINTLIINQTEHNYCNVVQYDFSVSALNIINYNITLSVYNSNLNEK